MEFNATDSTRIIKHNKANSLLPSDKYIIYEEN